MSVTKHIHLGGSGWDLDTSSSGLLSTRLFVVYIWIIKLVIRSVIDTSVITLSEKTTRTSCIHFQYVSLQTGPSGPTHVGLVS